MLFQVQNEKKALPSLWKPGEELPLYKIVPWLEHFDEFVRKNCGLRALFHCYTCCLFGSQIYRLTEFGIREDVLKVVDQARTLFEFVQTFLEVVCLCW